MIRLPLSRTAFYPAFATEVMDDQSDAVAYVYDGPYGFVACAFVGKRTRPEGNHSFRTVEARGKWIEKIFTDRRKALAAKGARKQAQARLEAEERARLEKIGKQEADAAALAIARKLGLLDAPTEAEIIDLAARRRLH